MQRYRRGNGYAYNSRKYYRRKGYRQTDNRDDRNRDKRSVRTVNIPTGIADMTRVKLKYTEIINVNAALPDFQYIFRGNSIFDPNLSGIGGQPLGHDQWQAFYERYCVNASAINVQILNGSTTAVAGNLIINLTPVDGPSVVRTYDEWGGYPYNVNKFIAPVSAGANGIYMNNYISTKKMLGVKDLDDVHESAFGDNPIRAWFWILHVHNMAESAGIVLSIKFEITYYVELRNRRELLAS